MLTIYNCYTRDNERERNTMTATLHTPDLDHSREAFRTLVEIAYPADNPNASVTAQYMREHFRPHAIVGNAHRIYDYMAQHNIGPDSWTRETLFEYAAADTGLDYETFYQAWITETPIVVNCSDCGTETMAALLDSVPGRCSDCVGAFIREATRRRR